MIPGSCGAAWGDGDGDGEGDGDGDGDGDGTGVGDGLGTGLGDGVPGLALGEGEGKGEGTGMKTPGDGLEDGDAWGEGLGAGPPWGRFAVGVTRMRVGSVGDSSGNRQPQAAISAKAATAWETFIGTPLEMTLEADIQVRLLSRVFLFAGGGRGWPASCSSRYRKREVS